MQQRMIDWYARNGYTLMSDATPAIGERFQAARVVCDRGLGAVILRTRRISVPAHRASGNAYRDDLNGCHLAPSEIEAWKPVAAIN